MWPNLLVQIYTYIIPFLTTPLDRTGEFQWIFLASWQWRVSSAQSTYFWWGSCQDLERPLQNLSCSNEPFLYHFWHYFLGSLSCWNIQLHPRAKLLDDYFRYPWIIWSQYSFLIIPMTLLIAADTLAAKQPCCMIHSPQCLTGEVFLWLKFPPSLLKTYSCSLWPNNYIFVSCDHRVFSQQQVTVVVVVFFLIMAVTQLCHALYTYKQLFAQLILGPVTALKWLQMTFLTCSNE